MRVLMILLVISAAATAVEWDPDVRLTDNDYSDFSYWSCQRRVVVDQAGRVHAAWYVMNSGLGTYRFQIYYKRYNPGSGWTADTMISADLYTAGNYCKYPSLAVDSSGTVFAIWAGGTTDDADEVIYLKSCVPGSGNGGWEPSSRVLSVSGSAVAKGCPTVTATPDGHVHAAWLEGNYASIVYAERIDTSWRAPGTVEGGSGYRAYPALAGGPDNRLHLSWYGRPGSSGYYNVWYKSRTDTTWGATENVSNGVRHQMYPSIAVNPATVNPHVLWQCYEEDNDRRTVHSWRSAGGWQPCDTLSEADSLLDQSTGQIIFTPDGRGHALWGGRSPDFPGFDQVRHCERSPAGAWSAPANVTDSSGSKERPSVAAGGTAAPNDIHVVWTDYRDGTSEIYYRHGRPGGSPVKVVGQYAAGRVSATFAGRRLDCPADGMLVDVFGRVVMRLHTGNNHLSRTAPGVYYFLPTGRTSAVAGKVVIAR